MQLLVSVIGIGNNNSSSSIYCALNKLCYGYFLTLGHNSGYIKTENIFIHKLVLDLQKKDVKVRNRKKRERRITLEKLRSVFFFFSQARIGYLFTILLP